NINYFKVGRIKTQELYKSYLIEAQFTKIQDRFCFVFDGIYDAKYKCRDEELKYGHYAYGEEINIEGQGSFRIIKVPEFFSDPKLEVIVNVGPVGEIARGYRNSLQVAQPAKFVSVVSLTTVNTHRAKAEDYLNTLVEIYNSDNIE